MDEKKIIGGIMDATAKHLPKTTSSLDTALSSIVNIFDVLLAPFQMLKEYKDFKMEQLRSNLKAKSSKIPKERLKESIDLNIVGPTLEALKYTLLDNDLREMFENLLVSSIDKEEDVFPSFVDIIRQLNSDEAKLLKFLSTHGLNYPLIDVRFNLKDGKGYQTILSNFTDIGDEICQKPELVPTYLVNLSRFGIIEIPFGVHLINEDGYNRLKSHPTIQAIINNDNSSIGSYEIYKSKFHITDYGKAFISACVIEK